MPCLPDSCWARPRPHHHPSLERLENYHQGHSKGTGRNLSSIAGSGMGSWKGSSQALALQNQKKSEDKQQFLLRRNPRGPSFRLRQNQSCWNLGPNWSGTSCLAARSALWQCCLGGEQSNGSFQDDFYLVDEAKQDQGHHPNPSLQGLGAGNEYAAFQVWGFLTPVESCRVGLNSTGIRLAWPGLQEVRL